MAVTGWQKGIGGLAEKNRGAVFWIGPHLAGMGSIILSYAVDIVYGKEQPCATGAFLAHREHGMLFRLEDVCGFEGGHDGAQSG